jgi:hypothetical protein
VKYKDIQNNTLKCNSYRTENTLLLHYKDKPVTRYETKKKSCFLELRDVVNIASIVFQSLNGLKTMYYILKLERKKMPLNEILINAHVRCFHTHLK